MATIYNELPDLPKFKDVKYFIQVGDHVRITDDCMDSVWGVCKTHPTLRTSAAYDVFESEFKQWLILEGKIKADVLEQSLIAPVEIRDTIDNSISKEYAMKIFNEKKALAIAESKQLVYRKDINIDVFDAIELLINTCTLTKDYTYFYGRHEAIGKFKIQYASWQTHHSGGNREYDIDGDVYYTEKSTKSVDILTHMYLIHDEEFLPTCPERPMGGGRYFTSNMVLVAQYDSEWCNWAVKTLKNIKMIKSTFGFAVATTNGTIEKSTLSVAPSVVNGQLTNEPPVEKGVLWLVNAMVFGASTRTDFVMFDAAQTVRDAEGKATAQGGYVKRDGSSHSF